MNLLVLAGGVLNFDSGVASVPPIVVRPLPPVLSLSVGDEHPASDSASHLSIVSARVVSRFVVVYGGLSLDEITISFDWRSSKLRRLSGGSWISYTSNTVVGGGFQWSWLIPGVFPMVKWFEWSGDDFISLTSGEGSWFRCDSGGSPGGSFGEVGGVSSPRVSFLCVSCFKRLRMSPFHSFFWACICCLGPVFWSFMYHMCLCWFFLGL